MIKYWIKSSGIYLLIAFSCQSAPESDTDRPSLFAKLDSVQTGIDFINRVQDGKDFNILKYRNFYNGGGVAIGDINGDGLSDIYFTANMGANKLYLNRGDWQFEDITQSAGVAGSRAWSTGVTMADVNGDGYLDIYVCNSGDVQGDDKENELFINQGDLTFKEAAATYGLNDPGSSTHASFFDYDADGDLDCYVLNNSFKDPSRIELYRVERTTRDAAGGDKLFRNDEGVFVDVSEQAGIYGSEIGFGLGVSVGDLNSDMRPDIYISNDFWERDYLYLNQGDGTFSEELMDRMTVISISSMGADLADINNDGTMEVFSTDMLPGDNYRLKAATMFDEFYVEGLKAKSSYHYQILQNCLQVNNGQAQFQELGFLSGIAASDWSWGALALDLQNDGWKDYFVCNGIYHDIMDRDFGNFISDQESIKKVMQEKGEFDFRDFLPYLPSVPLPNYAFVNQGNLTFKNQAVELGLAEPGFSNGAAYGDLDNDGDLDLVVNNVNMSSFVYRNLTDSLTDNHYLKITLEGKAPNHWGIGAEVRIFYQEKMQAAQQYQSRGFQSAVEPKITFGLGATQKIDSLVVIWPDLTYAWQTEIPADQVITLRQVDAGNPYKLPVTPSPPAFEEVTGTVLLGNYQHKENSYNDFDHERLLPHVVSTEGPEIVTGDINGDGLEDFILLGSRDDYDKFFIQQKGGNYQEMPQPEVRVDSALESTAGLLFDADGDQDQDLLLGAGGNEYRWGAAGLKMRYYENDGSGIFVKSEANTPPASGDISTIKAADIDGDHDLDLFIGSRIVPGNYGLIPRSYLLRNDEGAWTDITPEPLAGIGMVTDAAWSNLEGDTLPDLVVVGEWMPVTIFVNSGGQLSTNFSIPFSSGWWNVIEPADLDNDGDTDFILGNWGLNSKFVASPQKPLSMFVKDFDNNGKSEFIINWYPPLDSGSYPFASKMDITAQLPQLKKQAVKYSDYAGMTYEDLFNEGQRQGALEYQVHTLSSSILWNRGVQDFHLTALPREGQVSPVFGALAQDLDQDGLQDLLLMGNFYGLKPEVGRQNSSRGVVLKGDSNGSFLPGKALSLGINITGEVRDVKVLPGKDLRVLISRNNAPAVLLQRQPAVP